MVPAVISQCSKFISFELYHNIKDEMMLFKTNFTEEQIIYFHDHYGMIEILHWKASNIEVSLGGSERHIDLSIIKAYASAVDLQVIPWTVLC